MSSSEDRLKKTDFRLCPECQKLHSGKTTCPKCSVPLSLVDYTFFLGKSLGKYKITEVLGIGGMGIVFKALHEALNKTVAIKIFIPSTDDGSFEKRFLREARILAGLKHPNIIEVYDFDISQWGMPFYVMEYLEGKTLGEIIRANSRGLSAERVSYYLKPIIRGLDHAHKKGIVHRDLKPDNIFIDTIHDQEVLKILDFGIAKSMVADESTGADLTATETVLGTPYYLTPEQILNKNIGPHTDQYALALITGEMLSGQVIRGGKSIGEILYKEVHNPIQLQTLNKKRIPPAIGEVLVKATMPKPNKRYPGIGAFGRALAEAMDQTQPGTPATVAETVVSKVSSSRKTFLSIEEEASRDIRHKKIKRFGLIAAVVIIVAVLLFWFFGGKSKQEQEVRTASKPVEKPVGKKQVGKKQISNDLKVPVLSPKQVITAPGDAVDILSFRDKKIVLRGDDSIYVIDVENTAGPDLSPMEDRVLAGLSGGDVLVMDKFSITIRNFIRPDNNVLLNNPPTGDRYLFSSSRDFLAVKNGRVLKLFRIQNRKGKQLKRISLSSGDYGVFMALSRRYFVWLDKNFLHVYPLGGKPGRPVRRIPFEESILAVEDMVIDEGRSLLAIGGKFNRVYVFDLSQPDKKKIIPGGHCRALVFLPGSPTLVFARDGKLQAWTWKKGIVRSYSTPGATVTDLCGVKGQLTALDKNSHKLFVF